MTTPKATIAESCGASAAVGRQLILIRHVEADFHGRFCGHSNPGLSAQGRRMLPRMMQGLSLAAAAPRAIWSSDLKRAQETAAPIAQHFALDLATSIGLREMNFGSWEGLTWNEVELQYPEDARAWIERFPQHRPPGGESFLELQTRVIAELESLAERAECGSVIVVTHAGFIRTAIGWVLGVPDMGIPRIVQHHGAMSVLENLRRHWSVVTMNQSLSGSSRANADEGDAHL